MTPTVCVVGLGRLGAPLAACFAAKGFRTLGVDTDPRRVEAINRGEPPVFEPGLADRLRASGKCLTATQDTEGAVREAGISFIVVPTPSEPDGGFSLRHVVPVCEAIGRALRGKPEFHLVVLTSTVMPGATEGAVRPTLEQVSGKRCTRDFGLCYSPEFIALGTALRDLLNPDFILVGESDAESGRMLAALYGHLCDNDPPVARMSWVNAELAKLAVNTYVTTRIAFANMLARLCERLPGADADVVTAALGLDSRIGPKYLKGAIAYGGPCFPRDNVALLALARQAGVGAPLAEATHRANREEVDRLVDLVRGKTPGGGTVGILGLAYKPDTDVVEEAPGLLLALELVSAGVAVVVYDPAAMDNARRVLGARPRFAESATQCVELADVVVLATPWPEFRRLEPGTFERGSPARVAIDCWGILDLKTTDGVEYVRLGAGPRPC